MAGTRVFRRSDFSGALQNASTWLLRRENELEDGRNLRFNEEIGAIFRRNGYQRSGEQFTTTGKLPLGGHVSNFTTGSVAFVACNDDADANTLVRSQNQDGTWTTLINDLPPNADVYFCDYRDEVYISGVDADGQPFQPRNIDKDLNVSTTRNLLFVPWSKYFVVYRGVLYAANVLVGSDRHPDRVYKGSAPTGAFTFVRGQQTDSQIDLTFVDQVPKMTSATAPSGSVSHSSAQSSWEGWRIFDKGYQRSGSTWFTPTGTGTGWVRYDFGSGNDKVITHYEVTALATDAGADDPDGAPKTWTLQGSNDGTAWTTLHAVNDDPAWIAGEKRTYAMSNTAAWRYYRINVTASQGGSKVWVTINELRLMNTLEQEKPLQIKVDSARYVKEGMEIEIWKSGKEQKLYDITVFDVDKPENTLHFLPESFSISSVSTANETLTISDTTDLPTGTPIVFSSTATLPAPLQPGVTYYAINDSATTIKVASSRDNAIIGLALDITDTGTAGATHVVRLSYVLNNNDELYVKSRHGELTTLWNADYPTPDKADWTAVQPGTDSSMEITGIAEATNRLFVFTLNSANRFDGTKMIPFSKSIGCLNQRTIQNIDDDWLVWATARKRIYARNEAAGQQEYISRGGVYNKFLKNIPLEQLLSASSGGSDDEYVLYVGDYNGEPHRAVYDFSTNTWSVDAMSHHSYVYANKVADGKVSRHFFSDNGRFYQDDVGNLDDDKPIRFDAVLGKTNYGTERDKEWTGAYVYSQNAIGLKVSIKIDNGDEFMVGEIRKSYGQIDYETMQDRARLQGNTISVHIKGAIEGPPQAIEAFHDFYVIKQELNGYGQKQ